MIFVVVAMCMAPCHVVIYDVVCLVWWEGANERV